MAAGRLDRDGRRRLVAAALASVLVIGVWVVWISSFDRSRPDPGLTDVTPSRTGMTDDDYRRICKSLKPGEVAEWCVEYGLPATGSSGGETVPRRGTGRPDIDRARIEISGLPPAALEYRSLQVLQKIIMQPTLEGPLAAGGCIVRFSGTGEPVWAQTLSTLDYTTGRRQPTRVL